MNKKILSILVGISLIVLMVNLISASFCCEKTKAGAWCQPVDEKDECTEGYSLSSTGCQSTTYCRFGTCINSKEGTCSANTAQKICENEGGIWMDEDITQIKQCELGCCTLGTSSFFDTLTKCKKESAAVGISVNFNPSIKTELDCSQSVTSDVKGACVYDEDLVKGCKFITKKECDDLKGSEKNVSFYEKTLCSSVKLGTICEKSEKTTCYNGDVYFIDTCGNIANIYDASKVNDNYYWTKVVDKKNVACDDGKGNINSATCGVCDILSGSTCGAKRTQDKKPSYGEYLCRDLSCEYKGKTYQHGDEWCADSDDGNLGTEKSLPGSEHFVLRCNEGEILVEECRESRNLICSEDDEGGAACTTNRWQYCTAQTIEKDCLNENERDCVWVEDEFSTTWSNLKCVPKYAPADDSEVDCSIGTATCKVTYEKKLGGKWECVHNCYCLEDRWANKMNQICNSLGDCGVSSNYVGKIGWYEIKDLFHVK